MNLYIDSYGCFESIEGGLTDRQMREGRDKSHQAMGDKSYEVNEVRKAYIGGRWSWREKG